MATRKAKEHKVGRPTWKGALRAEIRAARKVLVLGIGNPDKADDAAGIIAVKELMATLGSRERGRVKILLGYEIPENLTGEIRRFAPGLVLMIDAVIGPRPVGMIFPVPPEDIPDEGVSTHKISLGMLVRYLETTVGCRVRFLGIQPGRIEMSSGLTASVEKSARALARWLGEALEEKPRS